LFRDGNEVFVDEISTWFADGSNRRIEGIHTATGAISQGAASQQNGRYNEGSSGTKRSGLYVFHLAPLPYQSAFAGVTLTIADGNNEQQKRVEAEK
jgi:hypothetical protein